MDALAALIAISGAIAVGAISPGPSFVLVARIAMAESRPAGIAAALGMALGGMAFALLALFGLTAVLMQAGYLYLALRLAGGAYLVWLAWRIWRGATAPLVIAAVSGDTARGGPGRAFLLGLATQLSNPKTAVVYASVFAALLPAQLPAWIFVALPAAVFGIELGWYMLVAVALSAARPRATYLRAKTWLDRSAAAVLGLIGVQLVADAVRTA